MPVCPNCDYEYVEGVTICPDCGEQLVDDNRFIQPEDWTEENWRKLRQYCKGGRGCLKSKSLTKKRKQFVVECPTGAERSDGHVDFAVHIAQ